MHMKSTIKLPNYLENTSLLMNVTLQVLQVLSRPLKAKGGRRFPEGTDLVRKLKAYWRAGCAEAWTSRSGDGRTDLKLEFPRAD